MFTYDEVFANKKSVLIVVAHPDDADIFFGAAINRLRKEGKAVRVLLVTSGARGSRENEISEELLAKERQEEEVRAMKVLGVEREDVIFLGYKDGEVESNFELIGQISKYIRKFKADIVCTHEPSIQYADSYAKDGYFVQHRDHRKVGEAVIDAVYPFSRDRSFFTQHYAEGIEAHTVYEILLTDEAGANLDFDYSQDVEVKRQAMREHKSQFSDETVEEILNAFKFEGKHLEKYKYLKLLW